MFLMQDVVNYVADELTKHLELVFYVKIFIEQVRQLI